MKKSKEKLKKVYEKEEIIPKDLDNAYINIEHTVEDRKLKKDDKVDKEDDRDERD